MAAFFGIIMVGSSTVALLNPGSNKTTNNSGITITGTPADNYPDNKRTTFCESGGANSSKYIIEYKIPTPCTQPLGITTDQSDNVWFTESNTGNLAKFDPVSKTFQEFTNQEWQKGAKSMTWGLVNTPDGNMWFSDSQYNLIWKFSQSDKGYTKFVFPRSSTPDGSFPQMLLLDGKEIFVNDFTGKKIGVFNIDQTGPNLDVTSIPSPGNYNFTSTMVSSPDGKLWYTVWNYQQGGSLIGYDQTTRNYTEHRLPSEIQAPNGISIDPIGRLWITDTASSYFLNFDPNTNQFTKFITSPAPVSSYGNSSGLIKTPITRPYWNHVDDKGRLWFNEQVANSIAVFNPEDQSLVEYLVPSKNPNWSDCGSLQDCGVAQVLDFTVNHDKVWFTEWVENNIGVVDSSVPLPFTVNSSESSIEFHRGQNATISFTIFPKEVLDTPISIFTSNEAGFNNLSIKTSDNQVIAEKPTIVNINTSADYFSLPGNYKVLISARYHDITISKFVNVTVE